MTIVDIRAAIRRILLDDADVSALVGGSRIYPVVLPQAEKSDSIVYTRISDQGDHHNRGPSGLARPRIQIDAWSQTAQGASVLANRIKSRLDGFSGVVTWGSNSPLDEATIRGIFFEGEVDSYDSDSFLYRMSRDYFVWFAER